MAEHTPGQIELDHDTARLLVAGDCGTLAMDVATGRQLLAEQIKKTTDDVNTLLAERDRLKTINSELMGFAEIFTRLTPEEGLSPNALGGFLDLLGEQLPARCNIHGEGVAIAGLQ